MRSGGVSSTTLNYTGQRLDGTGLLFYNARYYDPAIGRFISADTIVPGSGPLTVSPSDAVAQGMWGQQSGGAVNPQELNRYSYVNNNPLNTTDPTGHCGGGQCTLAGAAAGGLVAGPPGAAVGATVGGIADILAFIVAAVLVTAIVVNASDNTPQAAATGDYHLPGDVPDSHTVVRGGTGDLPEPGTEFSGSHGSNLEEAASGVPHGTIRDTTAGKIRADGGSVDVRPEPAYEGGPMNNRHVNVRTGNKKPSFSEPRPNPVPKSNRVPGTYRSLIFSGAK